MGIWEVAYYHDGILMVERYKAFNKIHARKCVISQLKYQVEFEYVKEITEQYNIGVSGNE